MAIFGILRAIWCIYDHLVYFVVIWYIFFRFGMLHLEKLATLLLRQEQFYVFESTT
jgi:hypothetical protein